MLLGDVEDDRACLEQSKIAVLVCRDQAEGMKAQMRGFLLGAQRDRANVVRLAHLLERPANPRVAREAGAAVGRPVPRRHSDCHREILLKSPAWRNPRRSRLASCSAHPARRDSACFGNSSLATALHCCSRGRGCRRSVTAASAWPGSAPSVGATAPFHATRARAAALAQCRCRTWPAATSPGLGLDHACSKQDRLVMVIVRFVYTAVVM